MSQNHSVHVDNETTIKEVLKLVALSELLQENFHEIPSKCNVSVFFVTKCDARSQTNKRTNKLQ